MGSDDTVLISLLVIITSSLANAQTNPPDSHEAPSMAPYSHVAPSMAVIIGVLIAALFFMGFFSIYIRHCTDAASGIERPTGRASVGRPRRAAAARGLDASVIETFPSLVYSEVKGLKIGERALECAVCLNEFEDDETLRLLPKCDHVFHTDCIDAWLASHTTCPVCRANFAPQPAVTENQPGEVHSEEDLEAQNHVFETGSEMEQQEDGENESRRNVDVLPPQPEVKSVTKTLNRSRTSGRPRKFARFHSMGHSSVQPGENTDRYTLNLPVEVRKQIITRKLNRTMSMGVLTRERSSRRGYRVSGEGSSRGKNLAHKQLEPLNQQAKSDRWAFLGRASSFLTRASSFVRSPRVTTNDGESSSTRTVGPDKIESQRPPV